MPTTLKSPESSQIKHYSTPTEYLALEELTDFRSEYIHGEIYPMTGGTTNHNQIILNLVAELIYRFKNINYRVFSENVRLWIPQAQIFTYPDVMIIAGEMEYYGDRNDTITNPQVIFEVLSPSTQNYDRQDKFEYYSNVPSFREYLLIDQNQKRIQQYSKKSAKEWILHKYDAEDQNLNLTSLELQISLEELYSKVKLETE